MSKYKKLVLVGFLIFGLIGFLDSVYLTFQHYNRGILPCFIFEGCEKVVSSSYATVAGIPISIFGAVYYLVLLAVLILFFDTGNKKALFMLTNLPIAGFVASLYLLFLQLFIIKAICFYCIVSLVSSTALFVLALCFRKFKTI